MNKIRFTLRICTIIVVAILGIFSAACHKNKSAAEDTSYANDQVVSDQTFNDIQTIADEAWYASGSLNFRTTATTGGPCASVTRGGDSVIIDFGSVDCVCHDGRKRRGQIIVIYTGGSYTTVGSVHTITFNNFYQNDNKITGLKSVTNMGNNSVGQPYYNIHIEGSVTRAAGGTISAKMDRVRTWIDGYNTTDLSDDVYQISGSGTLTRANGTVININITDPLISALSCHWIEAGTITCTFGGKVRSLNYGSTAKCDDQATLILANGNTRDITLP